MRKSLILLLILAAFSTAADRSLYVQSPRARLLSEARMDASGPSLPKGSQVTQVGEEGIFFKVRSQAGPGFVPKVFVSAFAPGERANLGSIDRSSAMKARARASNYSQTAAARGLSESQSMRVRGSLADFDFDAILWLEKVDVPADSSSFESGTLP